MLHYHRDNLFQITSVIIILKCTFLIRNYSPRDNSSMNIYYNCTFPVSKYSKYSEVTLINDVVIKQFDPCKISFIHIISLIF